MMDETTIGVIVVLLFFFWLKVSERRHKEEMEAKEKKTKIGGN